jgi:hypothetical protein
LKFLNVAVELNFHVDKIHRMYYKRILKTEMQNFKFSVVRSVPVKSVLNQILKF